MLANMFGWGLGSGGGDGQATGLRLLVRRLFRHGVVIYLCLLLCGCTM